MTGMVKRGAAADGENELIRHRRTVVRSRAALLRAEALLHSQNRQVGQRTTAKRSMDTAASSPASEDASADFDRSVLKVLLISTEHGIARTRALISEQRALICRCDYHELSAQEAAARLNASYEIVAVYFANKIKVSQELRDWPQVRFPRKPVASGSVDVPPIRKPAESLPFPILA